MEEALNICVCISGQRISEFKGMSLAHVFNYKTEKEVVKDSTIKVNNGVLQLKGMYMREPIPDGIEVDCSKEFLAIIRCEETRDLVYGRFPYDVLPSCYNGRLAVLKTESVDGKGCTMCGKQVPVHRCTACKVARYCSVDCQKAHWPKHKHQCNAIKNATR